MKITVGGKVYRVVEYDSPHDDVPHTWRVDSRVVKSASDKQITLKTHFHGLWRERFKPDALGKLFFPTPEGAVAYFMAEQLGDIEILKRNIKDAERAVAWAEEQRK